MEKKVNEEETKYSFELPVDKNIVSKLIRTLRILRKYSQTTLGRLIGVKKSQISKLEKGDNNISLITMARIFKALRAKVSFKIEVDNKKDLEKVEEIRELSNQQKD